MIWIWLMRCVEKADWDVMLHTANKNNPTVDRALKNYRCSTYLGYLTQQDLDRWTAEAFGRGAKWG